MLNFGQSAIFSVGLTAIMVLASKGIIAGEHPSALTCVTHTCSFNLIEIYNTDFFIVVDFERNHDCRRSGDGKRTPLSALHAPQLSGHSVQRDQTGSHRHEHALHAAQRGHQD